MERWKKRLALLLALCLLLALAGCSFKPTAADARKYVKAVLDLMTTGTYDKSSVKLVDIDESMDVGGLIIQGLESALSEMEGVEPESMEILGTALQKCLRSAQYTVGEAVKSGEGFDVPVTINGIDVPGILNEGIEATVARLLDDPDLPEMSEAEINNAIIVGAAEYLSDWLNQPKYLSPVTVNVHYGKQDKGLYGSTEEDGERLGSALFGSLEE